MPSHPSRVRGLKFTLKTGKELDAMSHPSRVRGLKSGSCLYQAAGGRVRLREGPVG